MSETKNKTVQQRAEEKYPTAEFSRFTRMRQQAYLSGDHDRQIIADAEYKELQEKALAIITENGLLKAALRKEWVSVDTPPEAGVRVRAVREYGNGKQEEIHTVWIKRLDCFDDLLTDCITHWQYIALPSPPKIEKGEKE